MNVTLPHLKEKSVDHLAGGSIGSIMVGNLGLEALELSFKLAGVDPQTAALFGLGEAGAKMFTLYRVIRDKMNGRAIESKIRVRGRLTELSEADFSRGKMGEQDHKITEVTFYERYEDGAELHWYDWSVSDWRVKGVRRFATESAILRI